MRLWENFLSRAVFFWEIPLCSVDPNAKIIFCKFWIFLEFFQIFRWIILIVISKCEYPPVNRDRSPDIEVLLHLECFFWSGMDFCQKPLGFICPNRQESNIESLRKSLLNMFDKWSITRITRKVEGFSCDFECESTPEGLVSIRDPTSREVLCGQVSDRGRLRGSGIRHLIPPVHVYCMRYSFSHEVCCIAEPSIEYGSIPSCIDPSQGCEIHMIIVIV